MTDRLPLAQHTKTSLDALYAELDRLTAELADYDQRAEQQQARADNAEAANTRVRNLAGRIRQGVPWTANDDDIAAHIVAALDGPDNQRTTADNPAASEWTPPPPGDRREQLPDRLLALIDIPSYTSTACEAAKLLERRMPHALRRVELGDHADRLHARCRLQNKFTGKPCVCRCHGSAEPPVHIGGRANAEDCPACKGTNPPYPFICPGPDQAAVDEVDGLTGAWTPDPPIGCLTVTTEPDPFGYEERERTGRNAGLTLPAETEATDTWKEPTHPHPCTAAIEGRATPGGRRVQCTREARHPENHVGPKQGANGRVLWTDHQAGATPHKERP